MFHPQWRRQAVSRLDETFDLLIIGGGITGCGVLMDAAQRGLSALLVEKGDLAAGTSSRSSKLIHGGLRYLRQMQLRVTRLACRERDRMLALNPDLVQPVRFLYPAHQGDRVPGWTVDLGLWMYDRLTERAEKHSRLTPADVRAMAPGLTPVDLERTLVYSDAVADDARLTLAVAATGFAYGGLVLPRSEVVAIRRGAGGRVDGAMVEDLESGEIHQVRARLVVNATGVWVDHVRELAGFPERRLRPSRGSHIILPSHRLRLAAAVTMPSPDDRRPVFLIPHPEGVLVGTTDLYHEGPLDDPRPTAQEVAYLLRAVAAEFPSRLLSEDDVVGAYAGLRPILDTEAEDPSQASREEAIWEERGLLSVAGGKLTTWRVMAEEVVDEALRHLPEERARRAAPCYTAGTPLVGLAPPDLAARLEGVGEVAPPVAAALARRLRGAAWAAVERARGREELQPLADGTDLSAAEVRGHLATGAVLHLEDLLLRRLRLGLWQPALARELAPVLRPLCQEELGWGHRRWDAEVEDLDRALEAFSPLR